MADTPKMVRVEALEAHTTFGHAYEIGDTYEVEESLVDTLAVQGKAVLVEVAQARRDAAAARAAEGSPPGTS